MTRADAVAAGHGQVFYHRTKRNADGTAAKCRVTGVCRTWVTRPDDFRLPVKRGLRDSFYITPDNMADWLTKEP
jgi:hypothetical protein